jgi:hypothetical protein
VLILVGNSRPGPRVITLTFQAVQGDTVEKSSRGRKVVQRDFEKSGPAGKKSTSFRFRWLKTLLPLFIVIGIVLRIVSGNSIILYDLIYAPGIRQTFPGTRTPENTVKSFYHLLDRGEYDRAWEISIEPDWTGNDPGVSYFDEVKEDADRFSGWTGREKWVQRATWELGEGGTGITLKSVEARIKGPLDPEKLSFASTVPSLEKAYLMEVTGRLLGTCSLYKFDKMIPVLKVGDEYRVYLSGTKGRDSLFYQSWFSNLTIAGSLWEQ